MQVLLSSPAWLRLIQNIQEQADSLQNQIIFGEVTSTGEAFRAERLKGQLIGLLSLNATAKTIEESLEIDIKRLNSEDDYE